MRAERADDTSYPGGGRISIDNFNFSKTFNEAIKARTTADQLEMKAERDLQRIEVEARQKISRARAEAEALSLQKRQVTPELLRLRARGAPYLSLSC